MAISVTHTFVTAKPDDPASDVSADEWNAAHTVTGAQDQSDRLDEIAALAVTADNFIVANGSVWTAETPAQVRTTLGLVIGTNVQAWDTQLDAIAALSDADSNFIVGSAGGWVVESGATARTSLGLGTGDSPTFTDVDVTGIYNFPTTSSSTVGVINQNSARFLHSFGTSSVFLGNLAGNFTFTGSGRNVGIGERALRVITTARDSTVCGYFAGAAMTSAVGNSLYGKDAGAALTTGGSNVAFGQSALRNAITTTTAFAIGFQALLNNTANGAMGFGYRVAEGNTSGLNITAIGAQAAFNNTGFNGARFTVIGREVIFFNISADDVVAIGYRAGYGVSGNANSDGTFVGTQCYEGITTGDNGIGLGFKAGDNITTGSNDIIIGYDVDAPSATAGNQLVIGNLIFGDGIDGTGTTISSGSIGIGIASSFLGKLHVDQSSTTAAIPVLVLDQGDIDDSFIDFRGTSAANGTRSISSDTTEDSAKFGAYRIEINGVTKWVRVYDDES